MRNNKRRVILPKLRKISDRIETVQIDAQKAERDPNHTRRFEPSHQTGCDHIEIIIKKQIFPEILNTRQERVFFVHKFTKDNSFI